MGASAGRFAGLKLPSFCQITPVADVPTKLISEARLDVGEAEALALAIKLKASAILLDEAAARTVAKELGIQVIGTLGLLQRAKQEGLVTEVAPLLRKLIVEGRFRVSPALVHATLQRAGELP
jgi:predicted nucleic acid-binding protein